MKRSEFFSALVGIPLLGKAILTGEAAVEKPAVPLDKEQWTKSIFSNAVIVNTHNSSFKTGYNKEPNKFYNFRKSYSAPISEEDCYKNLAADIGRHTLYSNLYNIVDSNGDTINTLEGARRILGRDPTKEDGFYLVIQREVMRWGVADPAGKNRPITPDSIHLLVRFYLTNDPIYKQYFKPYNGKLLKYL